MNIAEMAVKNYHEFGEYSFLTFQDKVFTNLELNQRSDYFAHYLASAGIQKNDRVLIMLPNIPEVIISYQAVLKNGAIIVPINDSLNKREVQYIVNHCEPRFIITNTKNDHKVRDSVDGEGDHPTIILVDAPDLDLIHVNTTSQEPAYIVKKDRDDVAAIIYTSGTTGVPKGAMITHGNIHSVHMELQALNLLSLDGNSLVEAGFSMLLVLPISHIYGLTVTMMSYLIGARMVLMPRFDIEEMFQLIEKDQINLFSGVPTIYLRMAKYAKMKNVDASSVRYWISGAAPLSQDVRRLFEEQFQTKIIEGYGLTESTSGFALQRLERPLKLNSVGQVFPESEVGVFDENYTLLQQGDIGELAIKGPNVMKGYYKMEAETQEVLKNGWLLTGDIGYIDEDNDVFIVDRKKDMIIRGGFKVFPIEVEKVLTEHQAVSEAGVIGVTHQDMGEAVKAFVTIKQDKKVTESELIQFCRQKLASYKVPDSVKFLSELPINELGKVLRKELRKFEF